MKIKYTTFANRHAKKPQRTVEATFEEFAELIANETASDKKWSRMIKMTEYHGERGKDGMGKVYGIECEYDDGELPAEWARDRLTEVGMMGLVETSFNNSPEHPKWHVYAPLAKPISVANPAGILEYKHLVDKLNGVFKGELAFESWGEAQCWYFSGNVNKLENRRTYLVKGEPLDQVNNITPIPNTRRKKEAETIAKEGKVTDAYFIKNIEHGNNIHDNTMRLIARMVSRGDSRELIEWIVHSAVREAVINDRGEKEWLKRIDEKEFERMIDGAFDKKYNEKLRWDEDMVYDVFDPDSSVAQRSASKVFVWESILAKNHLYALTAQWGAGKTAFAVSLAVRAAAGLSFQDFKTAQSKVLYLSGENPADVRTRILATVDNLGIKPEIISKNLRATSMPFAVDNNGELEQFITIARQQMDYADLIIFDTGPAHSSTEDENDNVAAKMLARSMRVMMDGLRDEDGYAPSGLALMHPSKSASKSEYETMMPRGGSGFSGEVDGLMCMVKDGHNGSKMIPHETKFRGRKFDEMYFENRVVDATGVDNFGNQATTVVTVERTQEQAEAARKSQPPSDAAQRILAALTQYETPDDAPQQESEWAIKQVDFIDAHAVEFYPDAQRPKKSMSTALKRMITKGLVANSGDWLHEPLDM